MRKFWTAQDLPEIDTFVEDGNPRVIVMDHLPPEANAMAMAKYSRGANSFLIHLQDVLKNGWKKFMEKFYVNYGHASIADCATTTACLENVSMLTAVAYEDHHSGGWQEMSTRYLEMAGQKIVNPLGTKEGEGIQEESRKLYIYLLQVLPPYIRTLFPKSVNVSPVAYEGTVSSKTCDIAGAFLPAGTVTSVGRHVNLRQLRDHLVTLRNYPLQEVREIADTLSEAAGTQYPSSGFSKRYEATEEYAKLCAEYTYLIPERTWPEFEVSDTFNKLALQRFDRVLEARPEKTPLPLQLNNFGQITYRHLIDYRSYRDEHRHCRSGSMYLPLLTTSFGFESWYLEQIPEQYREYVIKTLSVITERINQLDCTPEERQYYIPMGYRVQVLASWGLASAVYICDLRSGQTVHPTVRRVAQRMGKSLQDLFPKLKLYCDYSEDIWNTKRGEQTILTRKE